MKITKSQLKQIVKEELEKALNEIGFGEGEPAKDELSKKRNVYLEEEEFDEQVVQPVRLQKKLQVAPAKQQSRLHKITTRGYGEKKSPLTHSGRPSTRLVKAPEKAPVTLAPEKRPEKVEKRLGGIKWKGPISSSEIPAAPVGYDPSTPEYKEWEEQHGEKAYGKGGSGLGSSIEYEELDEAYSEKQRKWACAQMGKSRKKFKGKPSLSSKEAKEMCKDTDLKKAKKKKK